MIGVSQMPWSVSYFFNRLGGGEQPVCRIKCVVFITANGPAPNQNGREGAIGRDETAGVDSVNVKISKREEWIRRRGVWLAGFPP